MTIQICLMDTERCHVSEKALSALPFGEGERERLLSMKNPVALAQSLSALLALCTLLENRGVPPLPVERTTEGKPYFVGNDSLHFNLSHTKTLSVAALASVPIGIDIEFVQEERNVDGIAKRFFSTRETREWHAAPTLEHFFAVWTRKEARAKLHGMGLLQEDQREDPYLRTFRLTTLAGITFLSVAAREPITGIEWIEPRKDILIEPYET